MSIKQAPTCRTRRHGPANDETARRAKSAFVAGAARTAADLAKTPDGDFHGWLPPQTRTAWRAGERPLARRLRHRLMRIKSRRRVGRTLTMSVLCRRSGHE
jgi:hypothetical protein